MAKYRTLPVVPDEIEAIKYDGYRKTMQQIIEAFSPVSRHETHGNDFHDVLCRFWIITNDGEVRVQAGDYVIKGELGQIYTSNSDDFTATYEPDDRDED